MQIVKKFRAAGVLATAALVISSTAGCNLLKDEPELPAIVGSYISAVQVVDDASATISLVNDQLGAGSSDGPALTVDSSATVVNGGSIQQTVSSESEFTVLRIAVEELLPPAGASPDATPSEGAEESPEPVATSTGAPGRGYQQVTLSAPTTSVTVVVTIPQALPGQDFVLYFAAANGDGPQGLFAPQNVQAIAVGTGDVQISVSWDVDSDLDLHVVDPNGEEIYYGTTSSSTGGALDLDSNADCTIDGVRNENITWGDDSAPSGNYTVRVDLYKSCDVTPTHYVVTIQAKGQPTKTFTGTIDGDGDLGGEGDGQDVTTFEVPVAAG
jgi:hypothetical protein